MSVVWYQLYGFLVGRGYDRDGDSAGYYFSTYVVLPFERANEAAQQEYREDARAALEAALSAHETKEK